MKRLTKLFLAVIGVTFCMSASGVPLIAYAESATETLENSTIYDETENESNEAETSEIEGENDAETENKEVAETGTSLWFDEVVKPLLVQYGGGVLAFATAIWLCLKDLNKTKTALASALSALLTSNSNNETMKAEVETFKAEVRKEIAEIRQEFQNGLKALQEGVGAKIEDINETTHKLLEVEKLAYGDNAHLVSNGTAKRIAEVVDHGKNTYKQ